MFEYPDAVKDVESFLKGRKTSEETQKTLDLHFYKAMEREGRKLYRQMEYQAVREEIKDTLVFLICLPVLPIVKIIKAIKGED